MPTVGPNSKTSWSNNSAIGTVAWTIPAGNPGISGWPGNAVSNYANLEGFGFSLSSSDIIVAIEATITTTFSSGGGGWFPKDNSVKLIKGGSVTGTNKSAGASFGSTQTYGDLVLDLWGATWLYSDINASNFGVALSGIGAIASFGGGAVITTATITVAYSSGGPVPINLQSSSISFSSSGAGIVVINTPDLKMIPIKKRYYINKEGLPISLYCR